MGQKSNDQYDLNVELKLDLGVDSKWEENWNLTSNSNSLFRVKVRSSIGFSIFGSCFTSFSFVILFFQASKQKQQFFFPQVFKLKEKKFNKVFVLNLRRLKLEAIFKVEVQGNIFIVCYVLKRNQMSKFIKDFLVLCSYVVRVKKEVKHQSLGV